jgi:nucleoside-diphosphate-sugar epimerase
VKVAVTGTSGFIGRHLVEHLTARGDRVVPIRRPFEPRALVETLNGVEAVVHLAGLVAAVRDRDFVDANVNSTRIVAAAARDTGAHLVHVSSLAAAGPAPLSAPHVEDDRPAPITPYGRSKLAGERIVSNTAGLRWTALRPGIVYGPADRAMLPLFVMARRGVIPLVGRAGAAYSAIHVADAVRAIAAAVDAPPLDAPVFLAHPTPASPRAIVEHIAAAVRPRARIVPVPMPAVWIAAFGGELVQRLTGRPATINHTRYRELAAEGFVCRVDRLRERLGIVAETDLATGIAETAEWYRRERWL